MTLIGKPLLIRGARQIGKTYAVREFAKECFKNYIEVNFEKDKWAKSIFIEDLNPNRILSEIEVRIKKSIGQLKNTLIFLMRFKNVRKQ